MGYWEEQELRLMELEEELDASGIEDATEWEKFPEMESIMYAIAEREVAKNSYTREQYESDRAKAIAEGVEPRLIMSYSACLAWDEWQRTKDEWEDDDDEWIEMREAYEELEREKAERDDWAIESEQAAELAEFAERSAMSELAAFGSCQGWFFGSAEAPIVYETGFKLWEEAEADIEFEWRAWDAASEDITGFFELNLSV